MGPVRGGLSLALALLASPAWAEVCDKEVEGWDGVPVTALGAAADFWTSPAALPLAALFLAAALTRNRAFVWLSLAAGLLPLVSLNFLLDEADILAASRREGCRGPLWLLLLSLLSPALLLLRRRS